MDHSNGCNIPKSSYFNIELKKNQMLNVNYVMINELTKFKWTRTQLNNFLKYMLKEKMPTKHDQIGIFETKVQIRLLKNP
jgi:hypothetical protein